MMNAPRLRLLFALLLAAPVQRTARPRPGPGSGSRSARDRNGSIERCPLHRAAPCASRRSRDASTSPAAPATRWSSRRCAAPPASGLDDIKLEITQSGNVIEIDANHRIVERRNDNVVETDFDIQVPTQVKLDLRTFSAPVTVTSVRRTGG